MLANIFQPLIDVAEWILRFFHDSAGFSWGWSIVGLTVVVRLAILPLTFKQVRSMQEMQRLQPEMKKLQERYKDDRQRMNEELMKLYREHQVNPLGSCLPLLLQLPFFLSLFYLQQSEGFRALVRDTGGGFGVLGGGGDLGAASRITGGEQFLFIPDITQRATGGVLVGLILIYIVTQLGSSTVSAMAMTDKNQKRLMFALPFLFVPFIANFPAGLMVYWITTNTWTIGQQLLIRKVLPPPHLKDKDDEEAEADGKPKGGLGRILDAAGIGPERSAEGGDGDGARADKAGSKAAGNRGGGKGDRSKASGSKAAGGGTKTRSGGAKAGGAKGGKASGKGGGKASGEGGGAKKSGGGNGRAQKAPPPSPRKKKKRSGRRR